MGYGGYDANADSTSTG